MIGELLLAGPGPESHKIETRIMLECKKLSDKISRGLLSFAHPLGDNAAREAAFPVRQEVLEYIQLVGVGIDSFLETHPVPEKSEN